MSSSKRHFTAVIGKKEQGTYVSSSPSSAARKAVSKLCADDKKRKVQFYIREITQGSNKKVYGQYIGYMEKLKKPIELKGRVIMYKPVAKLIKQKMKGGDNNVNKGNWGIFIKADTRNIRDQIINKLQAKIEGLDFARDADGKSFSVIFYDQNSNNANNRLKESINQILNDLKKNHSFTTKNWDYQD